MSHTRFEGDLGQLPTPRTRRGEPIEIPLRILPGTLPEREIRGTGSDRESSSTTFLDIKEGEIEQAGLVQPTFADAPPTGQNWEGIGNLDGVLPPDTVGDVGMTYYIQMTNLDNVAIYTKTTGALAAGPFDLGTLWSAGDPCNTSGSGDVIVLYDQLADRWMLSQFAISGGNYYECVAVSSTSGDPVTGGWYAYTFDVTHDGPLGDNWFNDYPKFGVWPDAYYMTANQYGDLGGFVGGAWAFDRGHLLYFTTPVSYTYFTVDTEGGLLPGDLDGGNSPPYNSPNYLVSMQDDAWGVPFDMLRVYEFDYYQGNPVSSTLSGPRLLATEPFEADICNAVRGRCIPQPDTDVDLESLSDRLMHRLAYRNFGDYEAMVVNHTVKTENSAGVRWYELRKPSATDDWFIHQQDTFAPDDNYRWMGSVAMDGEGNIGIGYSVSSESLYPSIRYTGRKAEDALNTTPRREKEIIAGSGSQTHAAARWGDYSAMSVDPEDDCTFWYTQEYIQTTGSASWQTRIASFKFPSCDAAQRIHGTVYDADTLRGLSWTDYRAEVIAQPAPTGTPDTYLPGIGGVYNSNVVSGTYDVTARAYGYEPLAISGVTIDGDVQLDFPLTPADFYAVGGTITDANTGYPVRAHVSVTGDPFDPTPPDDWTWSDPFTGYYSLNLSSFVTYTFHVGAPGYAPVTRTVGPLSGGAIEDFALTPNLLACNAPGYAEQGPFTVFFDDLESGYANWNMSGLWNPEAEGDTCGSSVTPFPSSSNAAYYGLDSTCTYSTGVQTTGELAMAANADLSAHIRGELTFWSYEETECGGGNCGLDERFVDLSTDGGMTWPATVWGSSGPETEWYPATVGLPGGGPLRLRFRFDSYNGISNNYFGWMVDDVAINGYTCEPVPGAVLQPERIETQGCPCTPQVHELTFVNHTGLDDEVRIDYTTSPSVTVLEIPSSLGVVPDGGIRPFEAVVKIDSDTPPGATVFVTVTASMAGSPAISDTAVIEKQAIIAFDPDGWQIEPVGVVSIDTQPVYWHMGVVGTHPSASGPVGYYVGGLGISMDQRDELQMYDPATTAWTQLMAQPVGVFGAAASWIDGYLYVSGGYTGGGFTGITDTQVYSPSADTWDNTIPADIPASGGRGGTSGGKGICSSGTGECHFHVGGGPDGSFANTTLETWEYDPSSNAWTQLDDRPAGDTTDGMILGGGVGCLGYVFVGGDYRGYDDFFRLDATQPSGSQWTQLGDIPANAGKMTPAMVCQEDDHAIYLIGGDPYGSWSGYNTTVYRYDIDRDTWSGPLDHELNTAQTGSVALHMYDRLWTFGGTQGSGALDPPPHESLMQVCPDCRPRLELDKTGPEWVYQGNMAGYAITLANIGECTTTATLTDTIPAGVAYADHLACDSGTCWYDSGDDAVYWNGDVPPYSAVAVTFDVTATAPISTWVVNTARISPTNAILHIYTRPTTDSVQLAMDQLGYTYDTFSGDDWTGIDFDPYDVVIVGMDGGWINSLSLQKLRTDVIDRGKRLILLGGSSLESFAFGVDHYLVGNDTSNRVWTIPNVPHFTLFDPGRHPLAQGLSSTYTFSDTAAAFYQTRVTDSNIEPIAVNGDGYVNYFRKEHAGGDLVWFTNSPFQNYWTDPNDFEVLKQIVANALAYAESSHAFHVNTPPDIVWDRDVYISGTWVGEPEDGPFSVVPGDSVAIVDRLSYIGTFPLFATLAEEWGGYPLTLQDETHTIGGVACGAGNCDWGVTLHPGASQRLVKTFHVTDTGTISITGWLASDKTAPALRTVVLEQPQLSKDGPEVASTGEVIPYTITFNTRQGILGPTILTDALPAGLAFADALTATYGSAWYSPTANAIYWTNQSVTGTQAFQSLYASQAGATFQPAVYSRADQPIADLPPDLSLSPVSPDSSQRSTAPRVPSSPGTILWDQPLSITNTTTYANQDFETSSDAFDIYIADDFSNTANWDIDTIFVPGNLWNGGTSLTNALTLNWQIYADDGGVPDGDPSGDGMSPSWSLSLPPTHTQVTLGTGSGGYTSNVTLTLTSPASLPPGAWWLVFYPRMDFATGGQYGRQVSETANGYDAQVVNPGGGFGFPTHWTSIRDASTWGLFQQDFAFRLEGQPAPSVVTITFNVTVTASPGDSVVNTADLDYHDFVLSADTVLDVLQPEVAWQKDVYVNDVLNDAFPAAIVPSDTVQIVDRVYVTYTSDVTFTLVETWTEPLNLTGTVEFSAGAMTSGTNWLSWEAIGVAPNTWHALTKTFYVASTEWLQGYVTETLMVENADPQPDDRVVTFQRGEMKIYLPVVMRNS